MNNPLSTSNVKKGRSPKKNSKGYKLLLGKEKELTADRKLKRFNYITLLEKLFVALDGVRFQDSLVDQVKTANSSHRDQFKSTSAGLMHLLNTWNIEVDSFR